MSKPGPKPKPLDSLFDRGDGCWLWRGATNAGGYGKVWSNGRNQAAHRAIWERERGPIPAGMLLLHKCDTPPCVNPEHLWLGTHADNQADKVAKDRQARGERQGAAKLTPEAVLKLRAAYSFRKTTYKMLAAEFGVCADTVKKAVHGIYWRHLA